MKGNVSKAASLTAINAAAQAVESAESAQAAAKEAAQAKEDTEKKLKNMPTTLRFTNYKELLDYLKSHGSDVNNTESGYYLPLGSNIYFLDDSCYSLRCAEHATGKTDYTDEEINKALTKNGWINIGEIQFRPIENLKAGRKYVDDSIKAAIDDSWEAAV